jgi:hypothetical protein
VFAHSGHPVAAAVALKTLQPDQVLAHVNRIVPH